MPNTPRRFHLQRDIDITGASGTGRVADGVLWPDGTVSVRWRGPRPSTVTWDRLADAIAVHGHGGATRIVWDDPNPAAIRDTPPPGSTAEQLPPALLNLLPPAGYLSTACDTALRLHRAPRPEPTEGGAVPDIEAHVTRLHARCRRNHKFTGAGCICPCHQAERAGRGGR